MKGLALAATTVLLVVFCGNHPLALVRAQGSSSSSDRESSSGGGGTTYAACTTGSDCATNYFCYRYGDTCQPCASLSFSCTVGNDVDSNCSKCDAWKQCQSNDICSSTYPTTPYCDVDSTFKCVSRSSVCGTCWDAFRLEATGRNWGSSSRSACAAVSNVSSTCSGGWNSTEIRGSTSFELNLAFNYQGFAFSPNPDESVLAYRGYFQRGALSSEQLQATTTGDSLATSWTSCNNSVYQPPSDAPLNETIYTVQCGLEEAACEEKTYSVALIKIYSNGTEEFVVTPRVITYSKASDSCHLATVLLIIVIVVVVCAIGICACIGACVYCCCVRPSAPPPAQQPPQVVFVVQQQPVQGQVVEMKTV